MLFEEYKTKIKLTAFETVRSENGNYFEAVLLKSNLQQLCSILEDILGKALFRGGGNVPARINSMIEEYGGIAPGQTLYCLQEQESAIFAMLWPWQDNEHVTIKTGQKKYT